MKLERGRVVPMTAQAIDAVDVDTPDNFPCRQIFHTGGHQVDFMSRLDQLFGQPLGNSSTAAAERRIFVVEAQDLHVPCSTSD